MDTVIDVLEQGNFYTNKDPASVTYTICIFDRFMHMIYNHVRFAVL